MIDSRHLQTTPRPWTVHALICHASIGEQYNLVQQTLRMRALLKDFFSFTSISISFFGVAFSSFSLHLFVFFTFLLPESTTLYKYE